MSAMGESGLEISKESDIFRWNLIKKSVGRKNRKLYETR